MEKKPTANEVRRFLEHEERIVHLMLKSTEATTFFKDQGVKATWFDPIFQPLVTRIYEHHDKGCLLTADAYRHYLVNDGHKLQAPLLMNVFANCDIKAYADMSDMPVLVEQLKENFMRYHMNAFLQSVSAVDATGSPRPMLTAAKEIETLRRAYETIATTAGSKFQPIRVCDIADDPEPQWVWEDYIAKGEITLFSGLPKSGKTTLLAAVMDKMATGGTLVTPIKTAKVLVVSEERARVWKKRGPHWKHVHVVCKPQMEWTALVDQICEFVEAESIDVVVIDTLSEHAQLEDENDSAKVLKSLRYGDKIVAAGAALIYLHHNRKSGGDNGLGARGSNAIVGKVDVVVTVNRCGVDNEDNRRRIDLISRLSPSKSETIAWEDGEYKHVTATESHMEEEIKYMMAIPADAPGATIQDIIDNWSEGDAPARKTLQDKLKEWHRKHRIGRSGEGNKTSPYRYHRIQP